ncbi:hypothetical protein EX895_006236 [Sporisorium graminicola]|uniref:Uncharacterized protein n=1 Tax=Sporisorium graminicola TaxID=280036 RepID=A0A4U7KMP6_9BASI|nr:hypothetical protein EX895_006236 [Sporisorium graminicola]TKY85156.1 hypothetical protein EX895_006236 [Sporisorium graminicola]
MVKIASVAAGAAVVLAASVAANPSINTPASITQCQPTALTWSNAQGTVRLQILPAGQVSAAPIKNLPTQTGASGSYVWTVDIPANTNITIAVGDDSGTFGYASPLVVLSSPDSSCLNAAASSSSSGAAAGGAASSTSAASSAASSSRAASSTSSAAASSSSAASSSASRASSSTAGSSSSSSTAPAATSSGPGSAAAALSPATAGLSVLAAAGALLSFL